MNDSPKVLTSLPVHPGTPAAGDSHSLRVGGCVQRQLSLSREDLASLPQSELSEDFTCKEGWTVPSQSWRGVRVAQIIDAAGVTEGAAWVEFAAEDFRFTVPIDEARAAIVAVALNGEPLPLEHGGPARLVLPGADCYTSIKWLDRIELKRQPGRNVAREVALQRLGG